MNLRTYLIFFILSFLNISSLAIDRETYRQICVGRDLSYQKKLICKKHKRKLESQEAYAPKRVVKIEKTEEYKPIDPELVVTQKKPSRFKDQRIIKQQRTPIKPYVPGIYRRADDGDNK